MNKTMIFITCVLFYLFCGRSNAHSMDSVQQCQDSLFILTEENDTSCVSLLMFRHGCFEEQGRMGEERLVFMPFTMQPQTRAISSSSIILLSKHTSHPHISRKAFLYIHL